MNYEQLIRDLEEFENDIDINETGIYTKILDIIRHLKSENTELQKQVEELKERLHWIWCLGVDYDGFEKSESLKGLIDEMVELTQIESKDFIEYQQSNDVLIEIENKYGAEV